MANELLGTWRLAEYAFTDAEGAVTRPWGESAKGLVIFEASGQMSAQIMRPGRETVPPPGDGETERPAEQASRGYMAYFGRYEVDTEAGTLSTRVTGALNPAMVGTTQRRQFELAGERLTLRTSPNGPRATSGVLVWKRVAGR